MDQQLLRRGNFLKKSLDISYWISVKPGTRKSARKKNNKRNEKEKEIMKKKFSSQTAAKLIKNAILLTMAALALCALPGVVLATTCTPQTTWTGAIDHNWFNSGNWSNGVPDSSTAAVINNGGTAQINTSLPAANACSLTLDPGTVSVGSMGSLQVVTQIDVGGTGATQTGLLTVTGSVTAASVAVHTSGTLTGNGTLSTTSATTIYGTLAPGPGRLTISGGNLIFSSSEGSTPLMESKVTPTSQDNVDVSASAATATLTGKLSVSMSGTFTANTTYTLLHAEGGRINTFSSVSITYPCECFMPEIQYTAKDVNLVLAPAACCTQ